MIPVIHIYRSSTCDNYLSFELKFTHEFYEHIFPVGTSTGDIGLWDLSFKEKLVSINFKVWDIGACSTKFQVYLLLDYDSVIEKLSLGYMN